MCAESDSDSGTEELVQERCRLLIEAKEKRLAKEREAALVAAANREEGTPPTTGQDKAQPNQGIP